ncbi:hypothetical protein MVEN_00808000 [Mycena venus]|uniref:DUF6535 domain-containing protein n=1 Tax=Mycena venus TaxID=2733690 RepID=A0A8H7D444_9AGAR|nr:hypothetical protein MVEN_00808000 [Mycena venus]
MATSDGEKADDPPQRIDSSDESAASKLWAVDVSEAEKYYPLSVQDHSLTILNKVGLFSGRLTALVIESYKTLIPDSGDSTTVRLLAQISQQLVATVNGSTFEAPPPTHFIPSTSALICNLALWFIGLGLSLGYALIAMLLEREFLRRADTGSAPLIRARILYLYYRFRGGDHPAPSACIPFLLLYALFLPINPLLAAVTVSLFAIVVLVYLLLTLLPMWHFDYSNTREHVQKLMRDSDLKLPARIKVPFGSCVNGLLPPDASRRRPITCCKALWAIAAVQRLESSHSHIFLDFDDPLQDKRVALEGPGSSIILPLPTPCYNGLVDSTTCESEVKLLFEFRLLTLRRVKRSKNIFMTLFRG